MATIDSSVNNPAYQAAILASEMQRQAAELALQNAFNVPGGRTSESVTGTESNALALAITAASVADFRRRIVIAAQFGMNDGVWREGLRALGVGGGI
jgi:hypothetical protein